MSDVAAKLFEKGHCRGVLNAFGYRHRPEAMGEVDRGFYDFEVPLRIAHGHHEALVDLDLVGLDLRQIFKVRLPGAVIVD